VIIFYHYLFLVHTSFVFDEMRLTSTNCIILGIFSLLKATSWLFFSSALILFGPVIFEAERMQAEEMQKQQNRQVCQRNSPSKTFEINFHFIQLLLGPNAAMAGGAQR
jgi:hypothetical protein